jgi:tetratricopeptide (TPR) repeat protein
VSDAASGDAEPADPVARLHLAEQLFQQPGAQSDLRRLDRIIALLAPAITEIPRENLLRARAVLLRANAMIRQFEADSDTGHLDQALAELHSANGLFATGTQQQSRYLATITWAAFRAAEQTDSKMALDKAFAAANRGHRQFPNRPDHREGLARVLLLRYDRTGNQQALTRSVQHHRKAVSLTGPGTELSSRLSALANALDRMASSTGAEVDLEAAVHAHRQAAQALADGDPSAATVLCNLGVSLQHLYERTGSVPALVEAVDLHRRALGMTQDPLDIQYAVRAEGLANALAYLFETRQELDTLAEAIEVRRRTLAQGRPEGPIRKPCQGNLAGTLLRRYEFTGDSESLEEAERLQRELVEDPALRGRTRAMRMNAMGAILHRRGLAGAGSLPDLEEAARYLGLAIDAAETDSYEHLPMFRSNLASVLVDRHTRHPDEKLLTEAVGLYRHAIAQTPDGHSERPARVANLARALIAQAEHLQDTAPLDEADRACAAVLDQLPPTDPSTAYSQTIAAEARVCRFRLTGRRADLAAALAGYEHAARHQQSSAAVRFRAAHAGATLATEVGDTQAAYTAFADAVALVERVTSLHLKRDDQELILATLEGLPRDAAATAIAAGHPQEAVVLLEQARNVLLGRAADARTDIDALRELQPALAEELRLIQLQLDGLDQTSSVPASESAPGHTPPPSDQRADLAARYDNTVRRIRACPHLADFHAPTTFATLRTAAAEGTVIIVNVSARRCDALAVTARGVQVVELPHVTTELVAEKAALFLAATTEGSAEDLDPVLAWTWDAIAEPVLRALGLAGPPAPGEPAPRVWWCPTGMATFLPLHAAGYHDRANAQAGHSVLDWTTSSYTPTLRTLIRLRDRPEPAATPRGMLAVAVASSLTAPNATPLTSVEQDVALLRARFAGLTVLAGEAATCEAVLREMGEHRWIHFACHGQQNVNAPFEGHLVLYDDLLTVNRIARQYLPPGELVFLSACETFRAGEVLPDECVTLAGALQVVGYRHVIATQWELFSGLVEQSAAVFYDAVDLGRATRGPGSVTGVAEAVRGAMLATRETSGSRASYWACFVHLGP